MRKSTLLGKSLILPSTTLSVVFFLAAGSVVTVATTGTALHTSLREPLAPSAGAERAGPALALEQFCQQRWGTLIDGAYCHFEQTVHLGLQRPGPGPVLVPLVVFEGDTVRFGGKAEPASFVRGIEQARGTFIATATGPLELRARPGQRELAVREVQLERCFAESDGRIHGVACPPVEPIP